MKIKNLIIVSAAVMLSSILSVNALDLVPSGNTKTLVAYFSATGNTRAVANRIAELTGSDIYEIEPARHYAANPYDDSQLIQNEAYNDLRPSVANLPSEENIARYDTIYVGSPLWWHQPAMVVCTFLDAYDLSGKVIVPFITYGATTYLNEGMQKLFKCTPNSIHVPAELPEDIDPDNIRQPQNDDAGIDVPNSASQVEEWLDRMGLWPSKGSLGVKDIMTDGNSISIRKNFGGISVSVERPSNLMVYDISGQAAHSLVIDNDSDIALENGVYIVNVDNGNLSTSKKIIVSR